MADEPRVVLTWDGFGVAARELASAIAADGFRPDAIVAIARGGLTLAGALGYSLNVKMLGSLNVEFYTGVEQRLEAPVVLPPTLDQDSLVGKNILLVDDVADSGRTISLVKQLLLAGGGEVRTVVLYRKPGSVHTPTYSWRSTDRWILFPWSSEGPVPYPDA